jgi:hypothetical protein
MNREGESTTPGANSLERQKSTRATARSKANPLAAGTASRREQHPGGGFPRSLIGTHFRFAGSRGLLNGESNDRRVPGPERGTDLREDQRSGGRNPKGATGMKQGRDGSERSGRLETVRNRTSRLAGGWYLRRDLPFRSRMRRRGTNPKRGASCACAAGSLLPVTLRREGEDHERMGRGIHIHWPGVVAGTPRSPVPQPGQGHGGSSKPIGCYRGGHQHSEGHFNLTGDCYRDGDVALTSARRAVL